MFAQVSLIRALQVTAVGFGLSVAGASLATGPTSPAITSYIQIQEQLAADKMDGVKEAALRIATTESKELPAPAQAASAARSLAEAKDIVQARTRFKALSKEFVSWAEKSKPQGIQISYCPMAGAKWLQKTGDIRNPYYGKEMLECGEKVS